jgi:urate oxidase / 2-oxo-4-hydroxy-4-carboxy-5-ureidoimidazoline decarboxylase
MADPLKTHYGKAAVSVYRADEACNLFAAEVELVAHGDVFIPSYTEGDNSQVVATDSMKNFIHACALEFEGGSLDDFLAVVARTFIDRYEHVERVTVDGREITFERRGGVLYQQTYGDHGIASLDLGRDGLRDHRSGRKGLHLVKLRGCAFRDFLRDAYTTLPDAEDRPLFVHMDVRWKHADFEKRVPSEAVRDSLAATFDDFFSESIQHLVHEMGVRALEHFEDIEQIEFDAQNRLWDTALDVDGTKVYTDARPPFGVIHLTLGR